MTAEAFRLAAQMCRDVAEKDYRDTGLTNHAAGAYLCAMVLDIHADTMRPAASALECVIDIIESQNHSRGGVSDAAMEDMISRIRLIYGKGGDA